MNRDQCEYAYTEDKGWIPLCADCPMWRRFICRLDSLVGRLPRFYVMRCQHCGRLRWPLQIRRWRWNNEIWLCSERCQAEWMPF